MLEQEDIQGGRMKGGGCKEKDHDGYSKRVRDEEQNSEGVERQPNGCSKKRRIRSENWSAKETLQMLELKKAIAQGSSAKGSDAWKQIAQQLAVMNPESQARSSKQVSQRWDTLVKIYVSVEEQCCETAKTYGEVIDERQKRCKTEYRQLWHELIAQGNPGKRRSAGRTSKKSGEAHASAANGVIISQAPAPSLTPGSSQAAIICVRKFGEIAEAFTDMLDAIDRSISSSEERYEVLGQANRNIVTGSNWEPEDDQDPEPTISVGGLKKQLEETKAEVVRATQSMADTMHSISKAASTSESLCLEVDLKDWSKVIQRLSAISQKYQEISVQGIREEVGADVWIPNSQQQPISAPRSTHDHNNSTQRSVSSASSLYTKICKGKGMSSSSEERNGGSTGSSTFAGCPDIVPLSPRSVLPYDSDYFSDYVLDYDSYRL